MTKKYVCLLAIALGGCPAFEMPSHDGGLDDKLGPQDGKHDCFDGGVCDEDSAEPGTGNGGRGEPSGGGAGGEGGSFGGNGGTGGSFDPGPGGDLLGQFGAALDKLYGSLCDCQQDVALDQCRAGYEEARACQLAGLEASIDLAEPWLQCAVGALSEQADCIAAAACDPDGIVGCVAPNSADQDPITAKCGEGPAELEEQDDLCSDVLPGEDTGFPCFDGSGQVAAELVCDGITHCIDGSDEMVCEPSGDEDSYACGDGEQIDIDWVCDGEVDCTNGSDEVDCEGVEPGPDPAISCGDGSSVPLAWVCDGTPDCATGADEVDCAEAP